MKRKTILIVEDEAGIRKMTEMYLTEQGYNVITAKNGETALEVLESVTPQLILLDIEIPDIDGFTLCEEIRKTLTVPIIFLTVRRDTFDKVKSFEIGADDYVTKPFDFEELLARIKANIRRYEMSLENDQEVLKFDGLEIHLDNYQCYLDGDLIELSAKEMELLIHLAKHPNQVWTHEQLYDQVWKFDATGNIETVKVHISYLRKKLEKNQKKPKYIQTVRGFGYRFTG